MDIKKKKKSHKNKFKFSQVDCDKEYHLLWMGEMSDATAISDVTDLSNQNAWSALSPVREQKVEPNKPLAYN